MPRKVKKANAGRKPAKKANMPEVPTEDGDGLLDFFSPRNDYNNTSKETIKTYGDWVIARIQLQRTPVRAMLTKLLNLVSFGKFSDAMRKHGYDKFYHLAILLTLDNGGTRKIITVEKNQVLNINANTKNQADAEIKDVPFTPDRSFTLNALLNRTKAKMGDAYFRYDAFNNNCQQFIKTVLEENDLDKPELINWLYQDLSKFKQDIPAATKGIAKVLTHTGAVVDKLVGNGKSYPRQVKGAGLTPLELLVVQCIESCK